MAPHLKYECCLLLGAIGQVCATFVDRVKSVQVQDLKGVSLRFSCTVGELETCLADAGGL